MQGSRHTGEAVARLLSEALNRSNAKVVPWTDEERSLLTGLEKAGLTQGTERGQPVQDGGPRFTPLHATLTEAGRTAAQRLTREAEGEARTAELGRRLAQGSTLRKALQQCGALR